MANRRVSIWKYVRIGQADWRYCRPSYGPNNKIKPDIVIIGNSAQCHPEGNYYLRLSAGKGSWRKIGPKAADAVRAVGYEESLLGAIAMGLPIQAVTEQPKSLAGTLWGYLEDYRLSQRPESYNLMKQTLEEFVDFNKKSIIVDITGVTFTKTPAPLVPIRVNILRDSTSDVPLKATELSHFSSSSSLRHPSLRRDVIEVRREKDGPRRRQSCLSG
jgi:hypothetical protein